MKAAYFDCFAGVAGDMILGSILDAGLPLESLTSSLAKFPLPGYRLMSYRTRRGTITGTKVDIELLPSENPPSDLTLKEIIELLHRSDLPHRVKEQGETILRRLATAEAKVHGMAPEEMHFPGAEATDMIVDILGAVLGLYLLGVERVYASPLPSGGGSVESPHGPLPVPAPATMELIAMAQAPITPTKRQGNLRVELVTPTGAAILTTLASFQEPTLVLHRLGYGVGSRDLPSIPNVLSLWLGEVVEGESSNLLVIETNIDDMNPELYGYVMDRLFAEGARDVWFTPIQMKKNRPATMLSVLAPREHRGRMVEIILRETSTLGVRVLPIVRHEAEREVFELMSSLGLALVKVKRLEGKIVSLSPEFESCRGLALEHKLSLPEVYRVIEREAYNRLH